MALPTREELLAQLAVVGQRERRLRDELDEGRFDVLIETLDLEETTDNDEVRDDAAGLLEDLVRARFAAAQLASALEQLERQIREITR